MGDSKKDGGGTSGVSWSCLLVMYAFFSWLASAGLIVLCSNHWTLLSITMFSTTIDIHHGQGDFICLSNGPVFKLQGQLNVSLKSDTLYSCFEEENVLYFSESDSLIVEEDDSNDKGTLCYFGGTGIVTAKNISREGSKYEYEAICIIKGKSKLNTERNTSKVPTKTNLTSCDRQNVPSKFYTEELNVKGLEDSSIATCIVDVGIGFRVLLDIIWCLRFCAYQTLLCACADVNEKMIGVGAIFSSIELVSLVISAVLPYLYKNSNLELTVGYKVLLGINTILFIISLVPLVIIYRMSSLNCRIRRKKATTQRPVMTLQQLPLTPVIQVEKKVKVWELSPVTPAISSEDIQQSTGPLDDVHVYTVTELQNQSQDEENSTTVDLSMSKMGERLNDEGNLARDDQPLVTKRIELPFSITRAKGEIKLTTQALWNSEKVGIGRDARGLLHKNITIISVRKMNTPLSEQYTKRKQELIKYASCLPGRKIAAVQDFNENISPLCTMKYLLSETSVLRCSLNEEINEVLLFHGTKRMNAGPIERDGFIVEKCRSNYVGFGVYFAESPVKADQYTDKYTEESDMIVARVLLGKTALLKSVDYMRETKKPPCSTCLNINCEEEHRPRRRPFDSVVLARPDGLFREFVVYENCLAHPEYLITYKRV